MKPVKSKLSKLSMVKDSFATDDGGFVRGSVRIAERFHVGLGVADGGRSHFHGSESSFVLREVFRVIFVGHTGSRTNQLVQLGVGENSWSIPSPFSGVDG